MAAGNAGKSTVSRVAVGEYPGDNGEAAAHPAVVKLIEMGEVVGSATAVKYMAFGTIFHDDAAEVVQPTVFAKQFKAVGEDGEYGMRRNAPWKGYKWGHNQGGYRVPFVARWTGQITPGRESDALVSLTDFYATVCELFAEQADDKALDSVSFLSHMLPGRPAQARENMIYHSGMDIFGIREQDWLLVFGGVQRFQIGWRIRAPVLHQLYNIATDPGENINVYNEHPEDVARLNEVLNTETTRPVKG